MNFLKWKILLVIITASFWLHVKAQDHFIIGNKVTKYKLDSVLGYSINKKQFTYSKVFDYDSLGNYKSYVYCIIDSLGNRKNSEKRIINYNHYTKKINDNSYWWSDSLNDWFAYRTQEWSYDINGQLIDYLQRDLNRNRDKLIQSYKRKYISLNDANQIISYDSSWNEVYGKWDYGSKMHDYYDDEGKIKTHYEYRFNYDTNIWYPQCKHEYKYDLKGNLTNWVDYRPDSLLNWFKGNEKELVYDENNNLLYDIRYIYFRFLTGPSSQINNRYNNKNNLIESISLHRNSNTLHLDTSDKINFSYDDRIINGNLLVPDESDIDFSNNMLSKAMLNYATIFDYTDGVFNSYGKIFYHYSSGDFYEILKSNPNNLIIYPNPTTGFVNIFSNQSNINNIQVFDIAGKLVFTKINSKWQNAIQIDLSELNNGVYFVQVISVDSNKSVSKIILAK